MEATKSFSAVLQGLEMYREATDLYRSDYQFEIVVLNRIA